MTEPSAEVRALDAAVVLVNEALTAARAANNTYPQANLRRAVKQMETAITVMTRRKARIIRESKPLAETVENS